MPTNGKLMCCCDPEVIILSFLFAIPLGLNQLDNEQTLAAV